MLNRWNLTIAAAVAMAMAGAPSASYAADDAEGLPLGSLVVRPSVKVGFAIDSNVYRAPDGQEELDLGVEVVPELQLLYPGDNFRWDFAAHYRLFTYFNLQQNNHNDLRTFTAFGVRTAFDVNRKGKVGFRFAPEVANQPFTRGFGTGSEQIFSALVPLAVAFRPTSAFEITPNVQWEWARVYFPELTVSSNNITLGNRHQIGGGIGVDWRFFPRSHLIFDGNVGTTQWTTGQTGNINWRIWFGVKGDLTRKLSLLAMIGYGNAYFGQAASAINIDPAGGPERGLRGLLGKAELAMRPVETQRIAIGFRRDFRFRYYADKVEETTAYVTYKGLFADRVGANVDFAYTYRDLEGESSASINRQEHQFGVGAGVDVKIAEWLRVGGGYRFSAVDFSSNQTGEYTDHRGMIEVTFGYRSDFKSAITP